MFTEKHNMIQTSTGYMWSFFGAYMRPFGQRRASSLIGVSIDTSELSHPTGSAAASDAPLVCKPLEDQAPYS